MLRFRLSACLLALALAAGCKAQPAPQTNAAQPNLDQNRRIEVIVRSQFNLPQDYNVAIGTRTASQVPGYDKLPITFSRDGKSTAVEFLISSDSTRLARLETFDLKDNPIFNIDLAGRPIRGNTAAPVTIVNFDDLECPFCARMHKQLFPDAANRYKDKVRFIYKDDPLVDIHPWAMHAAVDANCLVAQSGPVYWQYVDYVHGHGQEINGNDRNLTNSNAALDRIARDYAAVGRLDDAKLNACLAKQDETSIRTSMKEADALGIEGTPALFINGERVDGAIPEDKLWVVIDRALIDAGVVPPPPDAPAPPPAKSAPTGK